MNLKRGVGVLLFAILCSSVALAAAKTPGPSTINANLDGDRLYVDFHLEWTTGLGCGNINDFEKVYQHSLDNREAANNVLEAAVLQAIQSKSGSGCSISDFTVQMSWDDEGGPGGVIVGYTVYEAVHFYLSGVIRAEGGDTVIDMRWRGFDAGGEIHFQSHLGRRGFDPDCIFLFDFSEASWNAPLTEWTMSEEDGKVLIQHKGDFKLNNELTGPAKRDAVTIADLEFKVNIKTENEVELSADEIRVKGVQPQTAGIAVPEWALYGAGGVALILVLVGVVAVLRRRAKVPEETVSVTKVAPKGKKFCLYCGALLPSQAEFCTICGKKQE